MATMIYSNEEMGDIIKIVKSFGESGLLINVFAEAFENESKNQKGRHVSILLGILGANFL